MATQYGRTAQGFLRKPLAQITSDMQANVQAGTGQPTLDLTEQTDDGKILAVYASDLDFTWGVLEDVDSQMNRDDATGASLDTIGDLNGCPREGESYTQVYATCVFSSAAPSSFGPGALTANVQGLTSQAFTNLYTVEVPIGGGTVPAVLFQATAPGQTPAVAPGTLTAITTPVTGWTSVTNQFWQSQLGTNAELDPDYRVRQLEELAGQGGAGGGCSAQALAAALVQLGAAQLPPVSLSVQVLENRTPQYQAQGVWRNGQFYGVTMPPNSWAPIVYDPQGWSSSAVGQAAIGAVIYANQPAGGVLVGTTYVTVQDPILGPQTVAYMVPTPVPIYVSVTVILQPGAVFAQVQNAIVAALVAAAVAPTPANGIPPLGQLTPGVDVVQSQILGVIASVPGVFDAQSTPTSLLLGTSYPAASTGSIPIAPNQVATLSSGNDASSNPYITVIQSPQPYP